jgi:hypothetical protein
MKRKSGVGSSTFIGHTAWALAVALIVSVALGGSALGAEKWFGIHGGPSIPSLQGGNGNPLSEGYTSRYGPYFGVFEDYHLAHDFALRAEVNFSSEGGQRSGMQPAPDPRLSQQFGGMPVFAAFKTEQILDYIEIPIQAKYSWGDAMRLFADAGPYLAYLVRAKTVTSGLSEPFDESGNQLAPVEIDFAGNTDIKSSINKWNYGFGGGLGVETPFGPGNVILDAHFMYGLRNIQRNTAQDGSNNTGALVFTLGYSVLWK